MRFRIAGIFALVFVFVFSFSLGLHSILMADGPNDCEERNDVGHCCINDDTGRAGVCVWIPPLEQHVECRCDCLFVEYPTCDGPEHCQYEVCGTGGGS